MMTKLSESSGQVLLIVIITMIVALTVGLSLASRTISNLKISKQNEDSQRAFQAASAGIEKYLNQSSGSGADVSLTNATFSTTVTALQGTQILLNNGGLVDQDRGIDLWLSKYPDYSDTPYTGTVDIYWGTSGTLNCSTSPSDKSKITPALEVIILSGNPLSPTVEKRVYDPCNSGATGAVNRGNGFSVPLNTP
jgi:Tfp pilus assembly protein PilX